MAGLKWQDVAGAVNRLEGEAVSRDMLRAARWFRDVGFSTVADLPAAEVEHDTALWQHGVPPELIGRKGEVVVPGDVVYQHVKGPVYPFLRFEPGPIGGEQP